MKGRETYSKSHSLTLKPEYRTMTITILQTDTEWANPTLNQSKAQALIDSQPGSDIYVLPEMWATGFCINPEGVAEPTGNNVGLLPEKHSLAWMMAAARHTGAAICGSLAIKTGDGAYRNRLYFVRPDGEVTHYDKKHLFGPGGESRHYTAGQKRVTAEYKGVRFLLATCYDLRFPVWLRYKDDYDAIIIVASWPGRRDMAWQTLLRARAIENQCHVIGVNRVGNDQDLSYIGSSAIINAYGLPLATCQPGREQTATATIDIEGQNAFRRKFAVLQDRDI